MSTIIVEVYEAFLSAGAPEEKAKAASKALAEHENRFTKIEADLLVLKWMVGASMAGIVSLVIKAFL